MSIVRCVKCGIVLTRPLEPLADSVALCFEDQKPIIPAGRFWLSDGDYYPAGEWIVNLTDLVNTKPHPDSRRRNGCCGMDGCDGINTMCANGHEVGTERSDCWWAHGFHFPPALIRIADD